MCISTPSHAQHEQENDSVWVLQNSTASLFNKRILLLIEETVDEAVFAVIFLHERHHFLHTLRHGFALDVPLHTQLLHHFFLRGHVRRHDDGGDDVDDSDGDGDGEVSYKEDDNSH